MTLEDHATCEVKGCDREALYRRLCSTHYTQYLNDEDYTTIGLPRPKKYCTVEGCGRVHHAKGLCGMHYSRQRKGVDIPATNVYPKICKEEGCNRPHHSKGLCKLHYTRQRAGLPLTTTKVCAVIGCDELVATHCANLCRKHIDENAAYWCNKMKDLKLS